MMVTFGDGVTNTDVIIGTQEVCKKYGPILSNEDAIYQCCRKG